MPRVALLGGVLLAALGSSRAGAQAPGAQAPVVVPPPPTSHVMERRWSVSAGLGWEQLQVKASSGNGAKITFGTLDLSGRFRVIRTVDVGLGLIGGGAKGDDGSVVTSGFFIDGRYRFLAEKPWNIYLGGGL